MNQIMVWVIVVLVILSGGFFFLSRSGDSEMTDKDNMIKDEMAETNDAMTEKDGGTIADEGTMEDEMKKGDVMMKKEGSYEPYTADTLARADSGDVVLFFRASWCPTCKALDANIRENLSAIPSGLTILDVNYDSSTALKQKYGVTYQHTLVQVASDGSQIKKWSGSPTLTALITEVQ